MTKPLEDQEDTYLVVVNAENQHALWPAVVDVPEGWAITFGGASRKDCLNHVERAWTDMRPQSLIDAMGGR